MSLCTEKIITSSYFQVCLIALKDVVMFMLCLCLCYVYVLVLGHPKWSVTPGTLKGLKCFFGCTWKTCAQKHLCRWNSFIPSQAVDLYFISASYKSFYWALRWWEGAGNSHLSNAEINVILEYRQILRSVLFRNICLLRLLLAIVCKTYFYADHLRLTRQRSLNKP